MIVGFNQKKLAEKLGWGARDAVAGSAPWLANKYDAILGAVVRATRQLSPQQLEMVFPNRKISMRAHALHIFSSAEAAWLTYRTGRFNADDMQAVGKAVAGLTTVEAVIGYGDQVRENIVAFLKKGDRADLDRMIYSHYGGEVSVEETMRIMLRHSTHHLKQMYWFMETHMGLHPSSPATAKDLEGIITPADLFEMAPEVLLR